MCSSDLVRRPAGQRAVAIAAACLAALAAGAASGTLGARASTLTLSIVGTSDLHGYFLERSGRGGIEVFAGYVKNLRAARAADGGAVLLIDAGDTFQGGVESDLSEGAVVVEIRGLDAPATNKMRNDFARKNVKVAVVKNTLAKRAIKGTPLVVEFTGATLGNPNDPSAYQGQNVIIPKTLNHVLSATVQTDTAGNMAWVLDLDSKRPYAVSSSSTPAYFVLSIG